MFSLQKHMFRCECKDFEDLLWSPLDVANSYYLHYNTELKKQTNKQKVAYTLDISAPLLDFFPQ